MAYYRGDYYRAKRGDFYRGDNWLSGISSFGSNLAAKVGNFLPSSWTPSGARNTGLAIAGGAGLSAAGLAAGGAAALSGLASRAALAAPGLLKTAQNFIGAGQSPAAAIKSAARVHGMRVGGGRRMNVTNPRALRKALRRVAGFGKMASRARRDIGRAATAVGVHRGSRARGRFGKRRAA